MTSEHDPDNLTPAERAALDAYAAPPPPVDLATRVLRARARRARLRLGGGLLAAALLLVVAGRLWLRGGASGEQVALTRTPVALAGRGVAVAEPGAALRYRVGADGAGQVEQANGTVRYEIRPGGPFTVTTRAGEVRVLGTTFQVELVTMKKAPLAAAATAILILSVYEGRVLLQNRHGSVTVRAGQQATASEREAPALAPDPPDLPARPAKTGSTGRAGAASAAQRAQLLREIAAARSARKEAPPGAPQGGPGTLDKEYIREQVREIVPLIQECYVNSLKRRPDLQGRIVLQFTISGEPDLGGLVESAEVGEVSPGLNDPSLQECMRESMYALRFRPPQGGGAVSVTYPFVLSADGDPGARDAGAR
jgi:hypothetical protein